MLGLGGRAFVVFGMLVLVFLFGSICQVGGRVS